MSEEKEPYEREKGEDKKKEGLRNTGGGGKQTGIDPHKTAETQKLAARDQEHGIDCGGAVPSRFVRFSESSQMKGLQPQKPEEENEELDQEQANENLEQETGELPRGSLKEFKSYETS